MLAWLRRSLQPTLALLDEGVAIYRRHFGAFLLIAAIWCVPCAIASGLLVATAGPLGSAQTLLLIAVVGLLLLPALAYLVGALARAADDAIAGRAPRLRAALSLGPLRLIGMSAFTIVYAVILQVAAFAVMFVCACPAYIGAVALVALVVSLRAPDPLQEAMSVAAAALIAGVTYLTAAAVSGGSAASLVYGLQPWALESGRFGEAMQRSLELIRYRLRANIAAWVLSAALVATGGVSVSILGALALAAPSYWVLGSDSRVAGAIATVAWVAGLVVAVPPLPIWMALLYRRNLARREGSDLAARVQAWADAAGSGPPEPPPETTE